MVDFLGALTNIFTGAPQQQAAQQTQQYLAQQQAANAARIDQTGQSIKDALYRGETGGLGALSSGYNAATNALYGNANPALSTLFGYGQQGAGALTDAQQQALQALQGGVSGAVGAYQPLYAAVQGYGSASGQASQAQADALGLNGIEGYNRAVNSFQESPGFKFQLGQGLDALTRAANTTGLGASGNTLQAAQTYGQGLANQEWQNYLTGLTERQQLYAPLQERGLEQFGAGTAQPYLTGGTGAANIYGNTGNQLANLYGNLGQQGANIYTGLGQNLANAATQYGQNQSALYGNTAANLANALAGLSQQQTSYNQSVLDPYTNAYTNAANAQLLGSKNLGGFVLSLAQLGAGGGLGGLGNVGTALSGTPSLPPWLK